MRRKNTFIVYKEKSKQLVNKTVTGIIAYEKGKKVKSQKLKILFSKMLLGCAA